VHVKASLVKAAHEKAYRKVQTLLQAPPTGQVWKSYYFQGSTRLAMRVQVNGVGDKVYYLLTDHLGSTSITVDANGSKQAEIRYKPWGETRYTEGNTPTDYLYTGQREEYEIGLYFYQSRFYDANLGRFVSADSIIPVGVQGPDRYAAMRNNPVKYIDPSGHDVCDEGGNCYNKQGWYRSTKAPRLNTIDKLKMMIWGKFGVTMSESDNREWSVNNLRTVFKGLNAIDDKLNGNLKTMIKGTTFTTKDHPSEKGSYSGQVWSTGLGIDFHIDSTKTILPLINILHEVGHLLDYLPATKDVFSGQIKGNPSWTKEGYVNEEILGGKFRQPVQAGPMGEAYDPDEYWADSFANYIAGNIKLDEPTGAGQEMFDFVSGALHPYGNP
jgi:RHS repeat-associated protein